MNKKELLNLIEKREVHKVEFKKSLELKDEIGEAISAFSNSCDGVILVGITDTGEVQGIDIGKKTIEYLANYIKQNTDNQVYPEISVEKINSNDIVVIKVKEAHEKPVFFKGRAYKRVGKSTHRVSASEIRQLAKEGAKDYWDEHICEDAELKDIDKEKVVWFLRKAKAERNFDIEPETPVKEALERLGLIKHGKITNAGILLFGKKPQSWIMQAETRCARFKGIEPLEFIDMKVFSGNIIDQRDNAVEFVKEHIKLHAKVVGMERVEQWEYPIEAVRESITNAVCHRDYELSCNVQVRIFDDRIEVWGCGKLPKPLTLDDLRRKHDSVLRNHQIGKCFFLIKFIEQWGTGTNRIIKECMKYGLPEPLFEEVSENLVITFRKYRITEEETEKLNERQKKATIYLIKHKKITNKEYRDINPDITDRTALNDLNDLMKKGIITAREDKKKRYYILR